MKTIEDLRTVTPQILEELVEAANGWDVYTDQTESQDFEYLFENDDWSIEVTYSCKIDRVSDCLRGTLKTLCVTPYDNEGLEEPQFSEEELMEFRHKLIETLNDLY